jgi:hypothetical protein
MTQATHEHVPAGFMGRPRHRLFMVFDDARPVHDVVRWLEEKGRGADDIWVLQGEEGSRTLDVSGRLEGIRGRVIRAVEHALSSDIAYLTTLQEALDAGATVVAVRVEDAEAAQELSESLKERTARLFAYFANWEFQPVQVDAP